jgi:hypothetical protein
VRVEKIEKRMNKPYKIYGTSFREPNSHYADLEGKEKQRKEKENI